MADRQHDRLIIAYMQARISGPRAMLAIDRQREKLQAFQERYRIPIDRWYSRTNELIPMPTPEGLIEDGRVYCLIAAGWDKLKPSSRSPRWPHMVGLCEAYEVRLIITGWKEIMDSQDMRFEGEPSVFDHGWSMPAPD